MAYILGEEWTSDGHCCPDRDYCPDDVQCCRVEEACEGVREWMVAREWEKTETSRPSEEGGRRKDTPAHTRADDGASVCTETSVISAINGQMVKEIK